MKHWKRSPEGGTKLPGTRLLLPRLAIRSMLAPTLGKLSREYPEILLDVTTDDSSREIIAEGFDAGIHFGEYIEKDMIAVRVSPDHRPGNCRFSRIPRRASSAEGSARSVATPPRQFPSRYGRLYRWEFEKGGKSLSVAVSESLIVDDLELIIRGAIEGVGPAFVAEQEIASELADGRLTRVLQDWCQPHPGFFIYCPSRRQQTAALSALVSILRL